MNQATTMLLIHTGEINSGKSTRLASLVRQRISEGVNVNGWLTLPHVVHPTTVNGVNCKKAGHNFVPIIDSKFETPIPFAHESAFPDSVQIGKYYLNNDVFEKTVPTIPLRGLFIIDEVGVLEMDEHKGFYRYLENIFSSTEDQIVIVQKRVCDIFLKEFARFNPTPHWGQV